MNKTKFRLLTLTTISFFSLACSCKWFDTDEAREYLFNRSDFVIAGRPILNVDPKYTSRKSELIGKDVLFKVDSVYKGSLTLDTILIIQDRGNCSAHFGKEDTLLVFGDHIKRFLLADSINDEGFDNKNKSFYYHIKNETFDIITKLFGKYTSIETSSCVIFDPKQGRMIEFVRSKK